MHSAGRVWNVIAIILVVVAIIAVLVAWFAPSNKLGFLGGDKAQLYFSALVLLVLAIALWIGTSFNAGMRFAERREVLRS